MEKSKAFFYYIEKYLWIITFLLYHDNTYHITQINSYSSQ